MSNDTKTDLQGDTWVLSDPMFPDEGWVKEDDNSFPKAYQDGGEWDVDADEDGTYSSFCPEFSIDEKCPFCGEKLSVEIFDTSGDTASVGTFCENHNDGIIYFPSHEVPYDSDGYDEGDTWVPYGDTYVKL